MDNSEIMSLPQRLGERVPPASQLILIGGGALALLGSPRLAVDIDSVGDDVHPSELHWSIMQIAKELKIDAGPVPLDRYVPFRRHRFLLQQNLVSVNELERITPNALPHVRKYDFHPDIRII